jgi:hypothetical protein
VPKPNQIHSFLAASPYHEIKSSIQKETVMILGMSVSTFILVHVVISLIGIFAGLIVLFGMFRAKRLNNWTALFLATALLTSVTR